MANKSISDLIEEISSLLEEDISRLGKIRESKDEAYFLTAAGADLSFTEEELEALLEDLARWEERRERLLNRFRDLQ